MRPDVSGIRLRALGGVPVWPSEAEASAIASASGLTVRDVRMSFASMTEEVPIAERAVFSHRTGKETTFYCFPSEGAKRMAMRMAGGVVDG